MSNCFYSTASTKIENIIKNLMNKLLLIRQIIRYLGSTYLYFFIVNIDAQPNELPKDYLFPIRPGRQNFISGSMGELRHGHFHAGIDIKTAGHVGLPVYATQSGYVCRVKISEKGYGKTLYLKHSDGNISVYGHLSHFEKNVGTFVLKKQYQAQWYEVDIYPEKGLFSFNQGDIIAYSGNSGYSGGPHLHFEIRNAEEIPMDVLAIGFREIRDNIEPVLQKIALNPLNIESRIEGIFDRKEFEAQYDKNTNNYTIEETIKAYGLIGLGYWGYDRMNETHNRYGINYVELKVNGKKIYEHHIEAVSFYDTHTIDVFVNYKIWRTQDKKFTRCYIVEGNKLPFYKKSPGNGHIFIEAGKTYKIHLTLKDSYGNTAALNFQVAGDKNTARAFNRKKKSLPVPTFNLIRNVLSIALPSSSPEIKLQTNMGEKTLLPAYIQNDKHVFLWNMQKGIPRAIFFNTDTLLLNKPNIFPYYHVLNARSEYQSDLDGVYINIPDNVLYDTTYTSVYITKSDQYTNGLYHIGRADLPLAYPIQIKIIPKMPINHIGKTSVYEISRGDKIYKGGVWQEDGIVFNTRSLGNFTLLSDTIPPVIKYKGLTHEKEVKCVIYDTIAGIGGFRAKINGKWLLMSYDFKTGLLVSERRNKTEALKGNFTLSVYDKQGNEIIYQTELK